MRARPFGERLAGRAEVQDDRCPLQMNRRSGRASMARSGRSERRRRAVTSQMPMSASRAARLWPILLLCACPGTIPHGDGRPSVERADDSSHRDARPGGVDVQSQAGQPCTLGKCGAGLICMGNICSAMCTEPLPGCNDKTTACAAGETCIEASSFSGACVPVTAKYQQSCVASICEPGTLCVTVNGASPKCFRLCKYGCDVGSSCHKTSNGCDACW
jgi:hypothetical protein